MTTPPMLARVRQDLCQSKGCTLTHDYTDPCAACVIGGWSVLTLDCKKLPSNATMAANLAKAVAKHALTGMQHRTTEEAKTIFDTLCTPCEFFIAATKRCSKCGCYLATKTAWKSAHCPINKW